MNYPNTIADARPRRPSVALEEPVWADDGLSMRPEWLTVAQAADRLNAIAMARYDRLWTRENLRKYMLAGKLAYIVTPLGNLIHVADLTVFIRDRFPGYLESRARQMAQRDAERARSARSRENAAAEEEAIPENA